MGEDVFCSLRSGSTYSTSSAIPTHVFFREHNSSKAFANCYLNRKREEYSATPFTKLPHAPVTHLPSRNQMEIKESVNTTTTIQ